MEYLFGGESVLNGGMMNLGVPVPVVISVLSSFHISYEFGEWEETWRIVVVQIWFGCRFDSNWRFFLYISP